MLKCRLYNAKFKLVTDKELICKPNIGDIIPVNYINETVKQVLFVTPLLVKEDESLEGMDLLVYID